MPSRDLDGPDGGAWVRRGQRTTPAIRAAHPGQRWPTRDPSVLLAGCGWKAVQYHGSREAIPHGLQLPGELSVLPACGTITRARSYLRARALPCCRRAELTSSSAHIWAPPRCAAVIPHSLQSRPPRRLTSRALPQVKLADCCSCCTTRAATRDPSSRRTTSCWSRYCPIPRRGAVQHRELRRRCPGRASAVASRAHALGSVTARHGAAGAASTRAAEAALSPRGRASHAPRVIPRSRGQPAGVAAWCMWGVACEPARCGLHGGMCGVHPERPAASGSTHTWPWTRTCVAVLNTGTRYLLR